MQRSWIHWSVFVLTYSPLLRSTQPHLVWHTRPLEHDEVCTPGYTVPNGRPGWRSPAPRSYKNQTQKEHGQNILYHCRKFLRIWICIYIYICVYLHIYISICRYIYIYIHLFIYVYALYSLNIYLYIFCIVQYMYVFQDWSCAPRLLRYRSFAFWVAPNKPAAQDWM